MDVGSGSTSCGGSYGANYIFPARRSLANSVYCNRGYIANSVVRFRSLVRRLVKIAGYSNKLLSQRGRAPSLAVASYVVPKNNALHKTRGAVVSG